MEFDELFKNFSKKNNNDGTHYMTQEEKFNELADLEKRLKEYRKRVYKLRKELGVNNDK